MTVTIPSGALDNPANCQFAEPSALESYSIKDYRQAYGPYQILCQYEDNTFVNSFQQSLKATADLSKGKAQPAYEAYAFAGFDGEGQAWHRFVLPSDQKPPVLKFDWNERYIGVSVFGKPKHTPFYVGLLWTLFILVLLAIAGFVGLRFYARYRYRQQFQAVQEDYWHKEHGI
jgi:hypothetical protein